MKKWEPVALMALVMALGIWLVVGTERRLDYAEGRPGAITHEYRLGTARGLLEVLSPPDQPPTYRFLRRDGSASDILDDAALIELVGQVERDRIVALGEVSLLFRVLNITTWGGLIWVAIGLGGQIAFFGRMAIQWIVSERERTSVVPPLFWYLSFIGGVCLFTYFVWRKDIVGVIGQTTGVVIYGRNIRLIAKERRRARRRAAAETARPTSESTPRAVPAPGPPAS